MQTLHDVLCISDAVMWTASCSVKHAVQPTAQAPLAVCLHPTSTGTVCSAISKQTTVHTWGFCDASSSSTVMARACKLGGVSLCSSSISTDGRLRCTSLSIALLAVYSSACACAGDSAVGVLGADGADGASRAALARSNRILRAFCLHAGFVLWATTCTSMVETPALNRAL